MQSKNMTDWENKYDEIIKNFPLIKNQVNVDDDCAGVKIYKSHNILTPRERIIFKCNPNSNLPLLKYVTNN